MFYSYAVVLSDTVYSRNTRNCSCCLLYCWHYVYMYVFGDCTR